MCAQYEMGISKRMKRSCAPKKKKKAQIPVTMSNCPCHLKTLEI